MTLTEKWETCDGCTNGRLYSYIGAGPFEDVGPCPDCVDGKVPPEGMIQAAAEGMERLAPNAPLRWYAMARIALVEAARKERP